MAITQDDFKKVWASTSSVPEYTFSDTDYKNGWEFVDNLPPTRAMWDELQRKNDEKMQFLQENGSMCFNSVADMKSSNLDAGQTALTKGYYSINDGGASIYAIRAKTQDDVDDGINIIILDNGNVAEKIQDATRQKEVYGQVTKTAYGLDFGGQDAAYYKGKLFMFPGSNQKKLRVYDWENKTLIGEYPLGGDITSHGNTLTFGKKFAATDTYPLLYSSGFNGIDADGVTTLPSGTCQVYRIAEDYSTTLVQDIRIGFNSSLPWKDQDGYNGEGVIAYGDFIADPENNRLYVINSLKSNFIPFTRLFVFTLPDTSVANVILQESDIIEYYDLPFYPWLQGACYYKNKIYLSSGYNAGQANTTALEVIDLINKKQCGFVDLNDIQTEGEGVVVILDKVYVGKQKWYLIEGISESSNIGNLSGLNEKESTIVKAINSIYDKIPIINTASLKRLTSADDLNTITTAGTYSWSGANLVNGPTQDNNSRYCKMIVMCVQSALYVYQLIFSHNGHIYSRRGYANAGSWVWNGWNEFAYAEDVLPLTGGTMTGAITQEVTYPSSYSAHTIKYTGLTIGENPTALRAGYPLRFLDEANSLLGGLYYSISSAGIADFRLINNWHGDYGLRMYASTGGKGFFPSIDNNVDLGNGNYRWKQLYAGTTTISTSDERLKNNIQSIPDEVLDAWGEVGWYQYQFKDSIEEKGENARLHTGAIAQRIESIFSAHGLDANRYGLLCYDAWDAEPEEKDEDGNVVQEAKPAGNRYSLRYEEALCMEAAYQRRRVDKLEERISRLESLLSKEK